MKHFRAIFSPNMRRDGWPLYLACIEIRLKRATEKACARLAKIGNRSSATI